MNELQQVGNFVDAISNPYYWVIGAVVLTFILLVFYWKFDRIEELLEDIERNTRKSD